LTLDSSLLAASAPWDDGTKSPDTPLPQASEFKSVSGSVAAILFDFDGTLTATPGEHAFRSQKHVEIRERAPLLAPRLKALRDAGICLGIISKSSELTIRCALGEAALMDLFDGPLVANAVGFEGKAGFIEELVRTGALAQLGQEGNSRVLLVDDDVRELVRARQCGIQTYAAPKDGGLQQADFDEIFRGLGLQTGGAAASQAPSAHGHLEKGPFLTVQDGGAILIENGVHPKGTCHSASDLRLEQIKVYCNFPVIHVNDSVTEPKFDTANECRHSLPDATDVTFARKRDVICGDGDGDKGCALAMRNAGAHVLLTETDHIRALQACTKGSQGVTMESAIGEIDNTTPVTGNANILTHKLQRCNDDLGCAVLACFLQDRIGEPTEMTLFSFRFFLWLLLMTLFYN
jgi:FMN phosphatase YigB (HAD superfamily)